MYCPKCLNNSLHINSRGVIHIVVNGKQMDAGRFLYNLDRDIMLFKKDLKAKFEEFFKWYSGFNNVESITNVEVCTSDVTCDSKCNIPLSNKFSIVDEVLSHKDLEDLLTPLGDKYGLSINLVSE